MQYVMMEAGAGIEPSDLMANEPRELPLLYPAIRRGRQRKAI